MLEKSSCSPEKHLGSPGLRRKKMMERGSPEKQSQFQQLTPEKHNQFHCEIGQSPAANAGLRQRARTVSTAGGETMKRELARKKLARLREQESKVAIKEETEETPLLARTTIFEKMGARSPTHKTPGRQRTSSQRQHIFQVKTESVNERCVIRNVGRVMSWLQQSCHSCLYVLQQCSGSNSQQQLLQREITK